MKKGTAFSNRLVLLRKQNKMKQEDLARELSDMEQRERALSLQTISGWESGDKYPPVESLLMMTKLFQCSADYLLGISDEIGPKVKISAAVPDRKGLKPNYHITYNELPAHDKEPIFVVFKDKIASNRWGILDAAKMRIMFTDSVLPLTKKLNCIYYMNVPDYESRPKYNLRKPLSLNQILKSDRIWVEMLSPFPEIGAKYNGWYRHNEDNSALVNIRGLVLPYEGLSISYNAYSAEF